MNHTFIHKPVSVFLCLLMVLSVFGSLTLTASAEAVIPKYKITINNKVLANGVTLPYTTNATAMKNKLGYRKAVTKFKIYRVLDNIGTVSGQNFTITKSGSEQVDIFFSSGHITPRVVCSPLTPCVCEATGYTGMYDGEAHTIEGVTVTSPESGATVKYGTTAGTYDLTEPPSFTDVGSHPVYYQVSAKGWVTKTGSVNVNIQGDVYYVKQNADGSWPEDASGAEHDLRLGDGVTYDLSKAYEHYSVSGWSTAYTASEADRTVAHQGETITVGGDVGTLYVYYSVGTYDLTFYADREGQTVRNSVKVGYGMDLSGFAPSVDDSGVWSGENQLSDRNSELFTFGGWATEAGKTVWSTNGADALPEAFDWNGTMPAQNVNLYPVWVANYIHVILDAGAWDQYNTYTQSKYDPATPVMMDQSQGRSFWKSTNITAESTDYDKYVNMDKMNAATRTGYTLEGWYNGSGMKWDPAYLIAREYGDKDANGNLKLTYDAPYRNYTYVLTLTARWKLNDAKVSFDLGAGSGAVADDGVYAVGGNITIPDALPTPPAETETGRYEFKGWQDKNGGLHQPGETIAYSDDSLVTTYGETNGIEFTAVYQFIPTGSLTFDSQGGSIIESIEQDVGTEVSLETVNSKQPARTGYTFGGWYEDSACGTAVADAITVTAEGKTIYAKWTVNSYTLSFDSKGGTAVESITQDYDTAVTAPADPTRTGYTFTGWDKTVPAAMPAGDVTFNATWQVNTYTVFYDTDGADAIAAESRNYGEFVVEPVAPALEGHTFIRWENEEGGEVSFPFTMPDGDVKLKAVWKENQTAPEAPSATADARTVTLTAVSADEEYIIVPADRTLTDGDWANAKRADGGNEIVFDGLVPHTAYAVYARKCETDTKVPSPASPAMNVSTLKAEQTAPAAQPAAKADLTVITVDPTQHGAEYLIVPRGQKIPADAVWTVPGEDGRAVFEDCDPNTDYDVYARMRETERQNPSDPSPAATVKGMADVYAPTAEPGLTYTGEPQALVSEPDETPEGYTVKYSIDGGATWTAELPTATKVGDYTVKVKYVGNDGRKDFNGDDISVSIGEELSELDKVHGDRCFCYDYEGDGLMVNIIRFICACYNFFWNMRAGLGV